MAALNIANLYGSAQEVEGVVRVNHPSKKTACNQSEYLAMDLSNITGSISAFAWDNKYHSSYIPKENDIICHCCPIVSKAAPVVAMPLFSEV